MSGLISLDDFKALSAREKVAYLTNKVPNIETYFSIIKADPSISPAYASFKTWLPSGTASIDKLNRSYELILKQSPKIPKQPTTPQPPATPPSTSQPSTSGISAGSLLSMDQTVYFEKLQEIFTNALSGQPQPIDIIPAIEAQTQDITTGLQEQTQDITTGIETQVQGIITGISNASDAILNQMNPYRGLSKDQIIERYEELGFRLMESKDKVSIEELERKINIAQAIKDQAKALYEFKSNKPYDIEKGFIRSGFDTFLSEKDLSNNDIPQDTTIKFIYKQIPPISIVYREGYFVAKQKEEVYKSRKYYDIKKWALSGGFYKNELNELRKIKKGMEDFKESPMFIFKARKI